MTLSLLLAARRSLVAAAVLALAIPSAAAAQAADTSPTADAVIARYVEAIGGRQALESVQGSRTLGTFEMPAAGVRGELEVLAGRPNLSRTTVTIPGMGTIESGFDGTTAWTVNPITGPRVLAGSEFRQAVEQAEFDAMFRDPRLFRSIEMVGPQEVGGEECYEIRFVWNSGREARDCFSAESGLLVRSIGAHEGPMGSAEVTTRLGEYREFGGIRFPTQIRQSVMGQEQVLGITSVEMDRLDAGVFDPPAEIDALVRTGS
jgi:hypothetical protein